MELAGGSSNQVRIAYLYGGRKPDEEEDLFLKHAEKRNIQLDLYNINGVIEQDKFLNDLREYDLVYNSTGADYVNAYTTTAEAYGKLVIDSPMTNYLVQDKWMFYLKCRQHGVPHPETKLLSAKLNSSLKILSNWNQWPIIIKRTNGCTGDFVEKADNLTQARNIIKKFWAKSIQSQPIIAQEFIYSPCYRVTSIGKKIVQIIIKKSRGIKSWKATGCYTKKFKTEPINPELESIVKKIMKFSGIHVCGIDLCKKGKEWLAIEVNSEPALDFVPEEHEKLVCLTLDLLKSKALRERRKRLK